MSKTLGIRKLQAKESREKIFNAAIQLFSQKDYNEVTIDEICGLAGLAKGTFYTYFKSKSDVLSEWYLQLDEAYTEAYNSLDSNASATDRFHSYIRRTYTLLQNEIGHTVIKNVFAAQLSDNQFTYVVNENRGFYASLLKLIIEGQVRGEFKKNIDSQTLKDICVYLIRGLHYSWGLYCTKGIDFKLDEETEKCFDLFMIAIRE